MIRHSHVRAVLYCLSAAAVLAASSTSPTAAAQKSEGAVSLPQNGPEETPPVAARTLLYGQKDVAVVKTKLRYTTLIVLPETEEILDYTCGDKDYWVVNGSNNFAYIKPAKSGVSTNLNLVTASGNIYSFLLSEISETPKAVPDLKIFVELRDDAMLAASRAAPRFVPAQDVETYKAQVAKAQEETRQAKQIQETAIQQGISRFVSNVRFPYAFEAGKKPFNVRAMYHDDRFTYIQARPEETPTLYELKDGAPNLVNFTYKDGVYTVDKILDRGYLAIGKQKLSFTRDE